MPWILSSASLFVKSDISRVWTSTAAQAEVRLKRSQGLVKLLVVRNLDVHYDKIQVLLAEQVPVIFIDWQPLLFVQPKNLKGFSPNAYNSLLYNCQDWHY